MSKMRMLNARTIASVALCAVLGLGACGGAGTEVPADEQVTSETTEAAAEQAAITVESQSLSLEGVGNARQLVGYVGDGGRKVKDGVLLRTAALDKTTDEDVRKLTEDYHLAEIVDLRMSSEIEKAPDVAIDGVKNLNLSIMDPAETAQKLAVLGDEDKAKLTADNQVEKYEVYAKAGIVGDQMYITFLSSEVGRQGYAQFFQELLALPEGQSLLFHCTQGKDRTGCAAMLILSALGVDEDTIMADYLLTNEFNADLIAQERQELIDAGYAEDQIDTVMIARDQVFSQIMENVLAWLKETYGSPVGYITQELGVTEDQITALQDKFLE